MKNILTTKFAILLTAVIFIYSLCFVQFLYNKQNSEFYKNHFLPGTTINNVDVSNFTIDEAKDKVFNSTSINTELLIKFRESDYTLKYSDVDFYITDHNEVENILSNQLNFFLYQSSNKEFNYTVDIDNRLDKDKLVSLVEIIPEVKEENILPRINNIKQC